MQSKLLLGLCLAAVVTSASATITISGTKDCLSVAAHCRLHDGTYYQLAVINAAADEPAP